MAETLQVSWHEVANQVGAPKARSSHAVAVVGDKAYVFGGEFEPRVPIDNSMHVFDLGTRTWSVADAKGDAPNPRIGVTMAAIHNTIYVFGGRDKEHEELNEFYSFNTESGEWKLLSAGEKSPPHRSYHAMAADVGRKRVFTFGGCGKSGRLNDLWSFGIDSGEWCALKPPSEESKCAPRGGPGLAITKGHVWVIFGFCGHELSDVHRYDLATHKWEEVETLGEKPTGRSVFGTAVIGNNIVIYGGEVDPSDLGHLGAGAFASDVFSLDVEGLVWTKLKPEVKDGNHPGARGWYAAAAFGDSMLVYGGNSDTNDRLDDMYLLTVEL